MKAEELRYNNIVNVKPQLLNGLSQEIREPIKDDAFRVLMIDKFFVDLQVNGGEWEFCLQDIEPIPLTEEILLKCGFKQLDKYTFTLNGLFVYNRKRGFVTGSKNKEIKLDSLHDLQNWYYYSSNKIELKIEL
jgi:hypothetical protein